VAQAVPVRVRARASSRRSSVAAPPNLERESGSLFPPLRTRARGESVALERVDQGHDTFEVIEARHEGSLALETLHRGGGDPISGSNAFSATCRMTGISSTLNTAPMPPRPKSLAPPRSRRGQRPVDVLYSPDNVAAVHSRVTAVRIRPHSGGLWSAPGGFPLTG
jgi:hypothetical protein